MTHLSHKTIVVVGASRGLGHVVHEEVSGSNTEAEPA